LPTFIDHSIKYHSIDRGKIFLSTETCGKYLSQKCLYTYSILIFQYSIYMSGGLN